MANLFDSLHPAVISAVGQVVDEVRRWGKPVRVCGEMAGDPLASVLLLGMGVGKLSMAGPALPRIKRVIRTFCRLDACELLRQSLQMEDASEVRELLTDAFDRAGLGGLLRAGQ